MKQILSSSVDPNNIQESPPKRAIEARPSPSGKYVMNKKKEGLTSRLTELKDFDSSLSISNIYSPKHSIKKQIYSNQRSYVKKTEYPIQKKLEDLTSSSALQTEVSDAGTQDNRVSLETRAKSDSKSAQIAVKKVDKWKPRVLFSSQVNVPVYSDSSQNNKSNTPRISPEKAKLKKFSKVSDNITSKGSRHLEERAVTMPDDIPKDHIMTDLEIMYFDDIRNKDNLEILKGTAQSKVSPYDGKLLKKNNDKVTKDGHKEPVFNQKS